MQKKLPKKSQENISAQIDARDAQIAKLSEERQTLDELWQHSAKVVDKIDQILG